MRQTDDESEDEQVFCLRHPQYPTNLRCGRCDTPICPYCMVSSPVGARCPDCARIGRPAVLDTSTVEMSRAVGLGLGAAVLFGVAFAAILWVIPFNILSWVLLVAGMAGGGYLVGEAVRIGSGNKLDQRLKYVAGTCAFGAWLFTVVFLMIFGLNPQGLSNIVGLAGLIIAIYVAMARVRV